MTRICHNHRQQRRGSCQTSRRTGCSWRQRSGRTLDWDSSCGLWSRTLASCQAKGRPWRRDLWDLWTNRWEEGLDTRSPKIWQIWQREKRRFLFSFYRNFQLLCCEVIFETIFDFSLGFFSFFGLILKGKKSTKLIISHFAKKASKIWKLKPCQQTSKNWHWCLVYLTDWYNKCHLVKLSK